MGDAERSFFNNVEEAFKLPEESVVIEDYAEIDGHFDDIEETTPGGQNEFTINRGANN